MRRWRTAVAKRKRGEEGRFRPVRDEGGGGGNAEEDVEDSKGLEERLPDGDDIAGSDAAAAD